MITDSNGLSRMFQIVSVKITISLIVRMPSKYDNCVVLFCIWTGFNPYDNSYRNSNLITSLLFRGQIPYPNTSFPYPSWESQPYGYWFYDCTSTKLLEEAVLSPSVFKDYNRILIRDISSFQLSPIPSENTDCYCSSFQLIKPKLEGNIKVANTIAEDVKVDRFTSCD